MHLFQGFALDTATQARAICYNGTSITALQQQLQDLKGNSGLQSFVQCNQPSVSTALREAGPASGSNLGLQGNILCVDSAHHKNLSWLADQFAPTYASTVRPSTVSICLSAHCTLLKACYLRQAAAGFSCCSVCNQAHVLFVEFSTSLRTVVSPL